MYGQYQHYHVWYLVIRQQLLMDISYHGSLVRHCKSNPCIQWCDLLRITSTYSDSEYSTISRMSFDVDHPKQPRLNNILEIKQPYSQLQAINMVCACFTIIDKVLALLTRFVRDDIAGTAAPSPLQDLQWVASQHGRVQLVSSTPIDNAYIHTIVGASSINVSVVNRL